MLERNCVVFCPNIGLLSTCVLSLIPLLRPFSWQHFLMPVLPDTQHWLTFLDSPTPFVVGIQVCHAALYSCCTVFRAALYLMLHCVSCCTVFHAALYFMLHCILRTV